jgi:hypothetical protein
MHIVAGIYVGSCCGHDMKKKAFWKSDDRSRRDKAGRKENRKEEGLCKERRKEVEGRRQEKKNE